MMYKDSPIFGSLPVRLTFESQGEELQTRRSLGLGGAGSLPRGSLEFGILVTGRLVAESSEALDDLVNQVQIHIDSPPSPGELIDDRGISYPDLCFVRFDQTGPIETGRAWAFPFRARFLRLRP